MNKFLTYQGTQPVYLGDIDFMQNAAGDTFKALAKALMNNPSDSLNGILQGVEISFPTSGTIAWTSGIVILSGEILPVAAGTISGTTSSTLYFHINSVLSGERPFRDGQNKFCYDTRSAYLSLVSEGGVALADMPYFQAGDSARDYAPSWAADNVNSASLKERGGLFYLEALITTEEIPASGASDVAEIDFRIKPLSNTGFGSKTYKTWMIYTSGNGAVIEVIPVIVDISVTHGTAVTKYDTVAITFSVPASAVVWAAGSLAFSAVIPLL